MFYTVFYTTRTAKMPRVHLTPDRIRKMACPADKNQALVYDDDPKCLAVRVTAGAKSFVFESSLDRRTMRVTLGDATVWTLDAARAEARRLQMLVDKGIDPRTERAEHKEARAAIRAAEVAKGTFTLRALLNAYVEHLRARGKGKAAATAASAFRVHLTDKHPDLADTPAKDVTSMDLAAVVRAVHQSGKERMSGMLRSYLNAAYAAGARAPYDVALPHGLIGFGITANPVAVLPTVPVNAGHRTLSADELRAYLLALTDALPDRALRLCLLAGGQRLAQVLRATVADWQTGTLRLFDGKGKRRTPREHLLPLGPKAAALVDSLTERARLRGTASLFCIASTPMDTATPGGRVTEISASLGGEPFTLRDIRRTCETLLAGLGISRDTRAQLLSHGISGVQATHYDRHSYTDEKRAALLAWEAFLSRADAGRVVRLRRGA